MVLKMAQSRPLLVYFHSFKHKCYRKTVGFSGIQTQIVGVEGEPADHSTTTTATMKMLLSCVCLLAFRWPILSTSSWATPRQSAARPPRDECYKTFCATLRPPIITTIFVHIVKGTYLLRRIRPRQFIRNAFKRRRITYLGAASYLQLKSFIVSVPGSRDKDLWDDGPQSRRQDHLGRVRDLLHNARKRATITDGTYLLDDPISCVNSLTTKN